MPEFIGVRCSQCSKFLVQQVNKSGKYTCPVCNAKQSVAKVYCRSCKAADVRKVVADLNATHGASLRADGSATEDEYEDEAVLQNSQPQEGVAGLLERDVPDWTSFLEQAQHQQSERARGQESHSGTQVGASTTCAETQQPGRRAAPKRKACIVSKAPCLPPTCALGTAPSSQGVARRCIASHSPSLQPTAEHFPQFGAAASTMARRVQQHLPERSPRHRACPPRAGLERRASLLGGTWASFVEEDDGAGDGEQGEVHSEAGFVTCL
jgi:MRN-interacting protein